MEGGRPRLGLALGGGGARGIAHVGVMKVFEEEGIRPDLVVGTSAGALAGVFLAAGISAARTAAWADAIRWPLLVRPVVNRLGLTSNERLAEFLGRALPVSTFDELALPFACVATDVETYEPVLLCEGSLSTAIRASCAIPGIVVPVARDGRLLIDGGVTANVPTRITRLLSADVVVAVDVNRVQRRARAATNMLEIILQAVTTIGRSAERTARDIADVMIGPDIGDIGVDELHRGPELIRAGERAARQALPRLRSVLAGDVPRRTDEFAVLGEAA